MRFLSIQQEEYFLQQPDAKVVEQWNAWMQSAGQHYSRRQWRDAISYSGKARDLSSLRLSRTAECLPEAMIHFTLASIYLSNTLGHARCGFEANKIMQFAYERLSGFVSSRNLQTARNCIANLLNEQSHATFVARYLSVPIFVVISSQKYCRREVKNLY